MSRDARKIFMDILLVKIEIKMKDDFPKSLAALKTADAVNAINGVTVLGMQNSCRRSGSGGN